MALTAERFICQSCGAAYRKWVGRCESCGEWNTVVEEAGRENVPKGLGPGAGRKIDLISLSAETADPPRLSAGIGEFDRTVGGGLVAGSATLIGGDPGIGKSTLLLQVGTAIARTGQKCVYISGEEAPAQVRMRARRLGIADAALELGAATSVRDILATLDKDPAPQVVVIDSIQTMFVDQLDSAPGTVAQVRASAQELIRFAKRRDAALLIVGHVTKEGQIAGPRVLEHMVDTVLYFEGERSHQFRILRAVKNRFGGTDEIGVFEMTGAGLTEVTNPSALFLSDRDGGINGAAVFAGMEGTRPVLVEIQALVAPSPLATPRRAVVGWDSGRLAMILAVLDARGGLGLAGNDVYLNVAGGLRIGEPAADLAVAAALISSASETPMPPETVVFGEISLSGEIRPVAHADARLKESSKLGFTKALTPPTARLQTAGIDATAIRSLRELVDFFDARGGAAQRRREHA